MSWINKINSEKCCPPENSPWLPLSYSLWEREGNILGLCCLPLLFFNVGIPPAMLFFLILLPISFTMVHFYRLYIYIYIYIWISFHLRIKSRVVRFERFHCCHRPSGPGLKSKCCWHQSWFCHVPSHERRFQAWNLSSSRTWTLDLQSGKQW